MDGWETGPGDGGPAGALPVRMRVNGVLRELRVDPRLTLLNALRERLGLTGTKNGCDRGACGACTVLADGMRVLSCLMLAVTCEGREIVTIEGLAVAGGPAAARGPAAGAGAGADDGLHPLQRAFIARDALQCGFCTPGQIMSAAGLLAEGHTGSAAQIRAYMSGNICRCGAYPNIVAAIRDVAERPGDAAV